MKAIRTILIGCSSAIALASVPAHASVDEYTVAAEGTVQISLNVCSPESQLAVRGDTGTDLDFVITDPSGSAVHSDQGVDDYLSVVLEKNGSGCADFGLSVSNLGDEENTFTVVLEPITEASARIAKYIIQAKETQTVQFKACGTSAALTARGDGDTDLDFVVRNSDGAVVHEDDDLSDETSTTLEGLLSDCETFEMDVVNLGEVYNALMVVIEPQGVAATEFAGTAPSTSLSSATGVFAGMTDAEGEGVGEYRAEANAGLRVNLPVCGVTRVEVRGDGDTDLDFTITNNGGQTVHSDLDLSDVTFATLTPMGECETFVMEVSNLGGVYNVFSVAMSDANARGGTAGAGEYRVNANAATKVALRVCEVTKVSAAGDGDTDLDFDVTDDSGTNLHSDYDLTDQTSFTLDPGSGCADYAMSVSNLGDVFNVMTVAFGEEADAMLRARPLDSQSSSASTSAPIAIRSDPASSDGQNREISILNQTGEALNFIYWSNSATLEWGDDKLGDSSILARGQQWNVNVNDGSSACLFDFRAVTESGRDIEMTRINACEVASVTFE